MELVAAKKDESRNAEMRRLYVQARRLISEASRSRRIEYADGSLLCVNELGARRYNAEMRSLSNQAKKIFENFFHNT